MAAPLVVAPNSTHFLAPVKLNRVNTYLQDGAMVYGLMTVVCMIMSTPPGGFVGSPSPGGEFSARGVAVLLRTS